SFATWRAAMMVFLYPENALLPSLRPRQTPAFARLVSDLRGAVSLTPRQACSAAAGYADYFRDVCSLDIEACARAFTRFTKDDCGDDGAVDDGELEYYFARSPQSGRVYASTRRIGTPPDQAQSFWDTVPFLLDVEVLQIVGATVYAPRPASRHLY